MPLPKPFKFLRDIFLSEKIMMATIVFNAAIIFLLYFPRFENNAYLKAVDHFFIFVYLVEAVVKIAVLKPRSYFSSGWNRFDFFIVIGSLPSLLMQFLPIPDTSLIVLLRLFRLLRIIRFVNFVPHIDKIIEGLSRALRAAVFVLMALLFLNFLLSVFTCHFYGQIAPKYFEDPLISAYSIFQMFTVEGWNEIPGEIAKNMGNSFAAWMTRLYFVMIVLVGGIFGMSLANAVFVDEMTMDNTDVIEEKIDLLQQQIAELKELITREDV